MVHVSNSSREIIVIVTIALCILVSPFMIYHYIKFNDLSHLIMFQKRHPKILKITGMLIIYWFIIVMPPFAIALAELDRFKGETQNILYRISFFLFPIASYGFFLTVAWRFWHIFYDLKYASSQKNSEWKYHLDPSLVEHNFWLVHKNDYGSSSYTKKIIIIWFTVGLSLNYFAYQCTVGTIYDSTIGHGVAAVTHGVVMAISLVLWWKIPPYADHFFIREEVRKISIASIPPICFTFPAVCYGLISGDNVVLIMFCCDCACVLFFTTQLLSFWYIPRKIRSQELEQRLAKLSNTESSVASSDSAKDINMGSPHKLHVERIVKRLSNIDQHNTRINMRDLRVSYKLHCVLSNPQTFKTFMQHLAKEFSMECLLCFAEIIQFKFSMLQRFNVVDPYVITGTAAWADRCPLTDVIPLSSINQTFEQDLSKYNPKDDKTYLMTECRTVCLKLYEKYIKNGSELEVNVSYEARSRLTNLMSDAKFWIGFNITPNELFSIYDAVATAMYRLMNGAYVRFKLQPEYNHVRETLDELQGSV